MEVVLVTPAQRHATLTSSDREIVTYQGKGQKTYFMGGSTVIV